MLLKLKDILIEYKELNIDSLYEPVAVGKYGIRKRTEIYKKDLSADYSKNKLIRRNTLCIGMGSNQIDIGVLSSDEVYSVSPAYHTYRIVTEIINPIYLDFLLKQKNQLYFNKHAIHSARQGKSLNLKALFEEQIEVPSILEQEIAIEQLQKIETVMKKEQTVLIKFEELVKSRFIELFGDLKINTKKWDIVNFTNFAKIDTKMVHDFTGIEDYPHIGIDSIEKNTGELSGYRTIKEDKIISGKYIFTPEHIIYSKIRPNLNKVALPNFNGVCSADAYPILVNKQKCNKIFLAYIMRSEVFLSYILTFCNRAVFPKVNKQQVQGFDCPLPPLELQNQFAEFVKQIDKLKFISQNRIKYLENLLNKQMDEVFN